MSARNEIQGGAIVRETRCVVVSDVIGVKFALPIQEIRCKGIWVRQDALGRVIERETTARWLTAAARVLFVGVTARCESSVCEAIDKAASSLSNATYLRFNSEVPLPGSSGKGKRPERSGERGAPHCEYD